LYENFGSVSRQLDQKAMRSQPPSRIRKQKTNRHAASLSRREFMALTGLTLGSALAACGATLLGAYWLLLEDKKPSTVAFPAQTRRAVLKTVERPTIVSRAEWGAREVNHSAEEEFGFYTLDNPEGWREYEGDLRTVYQTVVIHHSSLYEDDDVTTVKAIQDLHLEDRGWADIGYHFCIGLEGAVFEGRLMSVRGVHTEFYNTGSLGVCLLGNFEEISPTPPQLDTTQALINWLVLRLQLTHQAGHRDFNPQTLCPGANLYPLLDALASQALLKRGTEGYIAPPEQLAPTGETSLYLHDECCRL
jgi:hypothetical protein